MDIRDLFPCFPCRGKIEDADIEKQIKKDRKMINKTIPILLLGAAECGKSTVLKQVSSGGKFQKFKRHLREKHPYPSRDC